MQRRSSRQTPDEGAAHGAGPLPLAAALLVQRLRFVFQGVCAMFVAFAMVVASFAAPLASGAEASNAARAVDFTSNSRVSASGGPTAAGAFVSVDPADTTPGEYRSPFGDAASELECSEGETDKEEEEQRREGHTAYFHPDAFDFSVLDGADDAFSRGVAEGDATNRFVFIQAPRGPPASLGC